MFGALNLVMYTCFEFVLPEFSASNNYKYWIKYAAHVLIIYINLTDFEGMGKEWFP